MPTTSIFFGTLLLLVGIIGYGYGMATEKASFTALIPAIFGIVLILCGVLARKKENLRKHLMHGALVVALLGFIATAARIVPKLGSITFTAAETAQIAMAVLCLVFVILAIKSFADARRRPEMRS